MGTIPTAIRNITDAGIWQKYPTTNWNNVDRSSLYGLAGQEARVFYFFALPFNRGSTLLSAQLQIKQLQAATGSVTVTITRPLATWTASRTTWNNQPGVTTSGQVSVTKSSPAAGTVWTFDLKSMFQTVSNGAAWYGIRIASTGATNVQIWSPQAGEPTYRPTLTFTWSDAPKIPTMLYPSGGRSVGDPCPTLRCDFLDVSGDTTMAAMQVQINAGSNNFAAPTFDSGAVLTAIPELPLVSTSFGGMAEGTVYWWRAQVQDGSGIWSGWSVPTSMKLTYLPKVMINNPAFSPTTATVSEATPPIDWTLSSRVNLVTNPDFAVDAANWTATRGTQARVVGASPYGVAFLRYTSNDASTAGGNFTRSGLMATTVGSVYTASAWIRPQNAGTVFLRLEYMNAAGTTVMGTFDGPALSLLAGEWIRVSATGIASVGSTQARISLVSTAAMTVASYFDVDAVLFETGNRALPYGAGTMAAARLQRAYEVAVTNADIPLRRIWTTGKITSSITTVFTLPSTVLTTNNEDYDVIVNIWDDMDREAIPEEAAFATNHRVFNFIYSASVAPATSLVATLDGTYPRVYLNWNRSAQPDRWNIYRDGVLKASVTGDALFVSGTAYGWSDLLAKPRQVAVYTVIAVVNGIGSTSSPTATVTATMKTTTLMTTTGNYAISIFNAKKDFAQVEDSTVFTPAGYGAPFVITQGEHGYQGKITGRLASNGLQTSQQQRDVYNILRRTNGYTLALAIGDECFQCFIVNATIAPVVKNEEMVYDIAFEFYQTDFKP